MDAWLSGIKAVRGLLKNGSALNLFFLLYINFFPLMANYMWLFWGNTSIFKILPLSDNYMDLAESPNLG